MIHSYFLHGLAVKMNVPGAQEKAPTHGFPCKFLKKLTFRMGGPAKTEFNGRAFLQSRLKKSAFNFSRDLPCDIAIFANPIVCFSMTSHAKR